jgi:hypothetical protein
MKLYKILVNEKSCHGGSLKWSLPKNGKSGKWHEVKGGLKICEKGIHLTTKIFNWYKWGCTAYEAEAKDIIDWQDGKCVCRKARLLKKVKHPKWWTDCEGWVETLKDISWLKPDRKPKKEWKLFETRAAARDAARAAARDAAGAAARDAAWDAAWDAALYSKGIFICDGLKLAEKHKTHIRKRMEVWQKGYGLYADINGVLYVYKKI